MKYSPAQVRKAITAFLSFAVTVIAVLLEGNLIPSEYLPWVVAFVGVCGSYGVFKIENARTGLSRRDDGFLDRSALIAIGVFVLVVLALLALFAPFAFAGSSWN